MYTQRNLLISCWACQAWVRVDSSAVRWSAGSQELQIPCLFPPRENSAIGFSQYSHTFWPADPSPLIVFRYQPSQDPVRPCTRHLHPHHDVLVSSCEYRLPHTMSPPTERDPSSPSSSLQRRTKEKRPAVLPTTSLPPLHRKVRLASSKAF
ncbi:hypothetical protein F5Y10DRAFT_58960 [Nemania abortiva]|nr:hypothetical protein F5Y10DRAFT_58960 [Nemania abortiva]